MDVRLSEVRTDVDGKERIRQRRNFTYQERGINFGWRCHSRLKVDELVGGLDRIVKAIMKAVELGEFEKESVTRAQDQLIGGSRPPHDPQAGRPVEAVGKPQRPRRSPCKTILFHVSRAHDEVALRGKTLIEDEPGLLAQLVGLRIARNHQEGIAGCLKGHSGNREQCRARVPSIRGQLVILPA